MECFENIYMHDELLILNDAIKRLCYKNDKIILKVLLVALSFIKDFNEGTSTFYLIDFIKKIYPRYACSRATSYKKSIINILKSREMFCIKNKDNETEFLIDDYYFDEEAGRFILFFNKKNLRNFLYFKDDIYKNTKEKLQYFRLNVNFLFKVEPQAHLLLLYVYLLSVSNSYSELPYNINLMFFKKNYDFFPEMEPKKVKYELKKLIIKINELDIGLKIDEITKSKHQAIFLEIKINNLCYKKNEEKRERSIGQIKNTQKKEMINSFYSII